MAEFQEVLKQWKRMCKTFENESENKFRPCGELCPVGSNPVCGDLTEATQKDMEVFEMTVMKWAAENPEPEYPTDGAELKSCPFCGCMPIVKSLIVKSFDMYGEKRFYIMCPACRAEISEPVASKEEAAQAWNRRVKHIW